MPVNPMGPSGAGGEEPLLHDEAGYRLLFAPEVSKGMGITADGIVGPSTWLALESSRSATTRTDGRAPYAQAYA